MQKRGHRHGGGARHDILFGRQPVAEVLRAGRRRVLRVYLKLEARPGPELDEILALATRAGVPVDPVEPCRLDRMTEDGHHQGVAVEVSPFPYLSIDDLLAEVKRCAEDPFLLLLDHVQDPQNLGALMRTAEACGVHGVILPSDRAASVTPAAVRASAGAAEHLSVSMVTNLVRVMQQLKEEGIWLAGLEGIPEASLYTEADLSGPIGLVVGSEGKGLGRLVREHCDFLVRLPIRGRVGSLNASVAGAVAMYDIRRRRDTQGSSDAATCREGTIP